MPSNYRARVRATAQRQDQGSFFSSSQFRKRLLSVSVQYIRRIPVWAFSPGLGGARRDPASGNVLSRRGLIESTTLVLCFDQPRHREKVTSVFDIARQLFWQEIKQNARPHGG